jgi:hypothetical protein
MHGAYSDCFPTAKGFQNFAKASSSVSLGSESAQRDISPVHIHSRICHDHDAENETPERLPTIAMG